MQSRLEEMARRLGQSPDEDKPNANSGNAKDPLGRASSDDGSTKIPGQNIPTKVRMLFDEIRRRAQDGQRPKEERDYLHRLIDGN